MVDFNKAVYQEPSKFRQGLSDIAASREMPKFGESELIVIIPDSIEEAIDHIESNGLTEKEGYVLFNTFNEDPDIDLRGAMDTAVEGRENVVVVADTINRLKVGKNLLDEAKDCGATVRVVNTAEPERSLIYVASV